MAISYASVSNAPATSKRRANIVAGGDTFANGVQTLRAKPAVEVVKRTFGWLMFQRRLVRGYERTTTSAEAWIISP